MTAHYIHFANSFTCHMPLTSFGGSLRVMGDTVGDCQPFVPQRAVMDCSDISEFGTKLNAGGKKRMGNPACKLAFVERGRKKCSKQYESCHQSCVCVCAFHSPDQERSCQLARRGERPGGCRTAAVWSRLEGWQGRHTCDESVWVWVCLCFVSITVREEQLQFKTMHKKQ